MGTDFIKRFERHARWLCGEVKSIGVECMNKNRKRRISPTSDFRAPSSKACKTGYEPKEVENE